MSVNTNFAPLASFLPLGYIGKMDREPSTRKSVTLPDSMWEEIAEYRFAERIATEAEAVRRLLQEALDRAAKRATRRG